MKIIPFKATHLIRPHKNRLKPPLVYAPNQPPRSIFQPDWTHSKFQQHILLHCNTINIQESNDILQALKVAHIKPSTTLLDSLLRAISISNDFDVQETLQFYSSIEPLYPLRQPTIITHLVIMLNALHSDNLFVFNYWFHDLLHSFWPIDLNLFHSLLCAHIDLLIRSGKSRNSELKEAALQSLFKVNREMKKVGFLDTSRQTKLLVLGLCHVNLLDEALEVYRLKEKVPDVIMIDAILTARIRANGILVRATLREYENYHLVPSIGVFVNLMAFYYSLGKIRAVHMYYIQGCKVYGDKLMSYARKAYIGEVAIDHSVEHNSITSFDDFNFGKKERVLERLDEKNVVFELFGEHAVWEEICPKTVAQGHCEWGFKF